MSHSILILYSSTDGQTLEICQRIAAMLESHGHAVSLAPISSPQEGLESFDKIVIGARIRYGRHHQDVYEFIEKHLPLLQARPSAFFSVNVVARKPNKNTPETNPYMRRFLGQIAWRPDALAVFAGKFDYSKYRFLDRQMIRLIMYITHGPTAPDTVADFTDWKKVDAFAGRLCTLGTRG